MVRRRLLRGCTPGGATSLSASNKKTVQCCQRQNQNQRKLYTVRRQPGYSGPGSAVSRWTQKTFWKHLGGPGASAGHPDGREGIACAKNQCRRQPWHLRGLVGMVMGHTTAVIVHLQSRVCVVVVIRLLRMHNHVRNRLFLLVEVHRRQPGHRLPQHGHQQQQGAGWVDHGRIVGATACVPGYGITFESKMIAISAYW